MPNNHFINLPAGLGLPVALYKKPNGRPDKACYCDTTKAASLQANKKLPKYTPFSLTLWF